MPAAYDESSSDDDLYDNFQKYKAAVQARPAPSPSKIRKATEENSDTSDDSDVPSPSSLVKPKPTLKHKIAQKQPKTSEAPVAPKVPEVLTLDDEIELEIRTGQPYRSARVPAPPKPVPQKRKTPVVPKATQAPTSIVDGYGPPLRKPTTAAAAATPEIFTLDDEDESFEYTQFLEPEEIRCKIRLKDLLKIGPELTVDWPMKSPFSELAAKYTRVLGAKSGRMRFWIGDRQCAPDSTPEKETFSQREANLLEYMDDVNMEPAEDKANCIELKFQVKGGKPVALSVGKNEDFCSIKERLLSKHGIGESAFFVFDCEPVEDDTTPAAMDMESGDCVDVHAK